MPGWLPGRLFDVRARLWPVETDAEGSGTGYSMWLPATLVFQRKGPQNAWTEALLAIKLRGSLKDS